MHIVGGSCFAAQANVSLIIDVALLKVVSVALGFVAVEDVAPRAVTATAAAAAVAGVSVTAATESDDLLTVVVYLYGWGAEQTSYFAAAEAVAAAGFAAEAVADVAADVTAVPAAAAAAGVIADVVAGFVADLSVMADGSGSQAVAAGLEPGPVLETV